MRIKRTNSNKKTVRFTRKIPVLVWFDFKCVMCGSEKNLTVDHQKPRYAGGTHAQKNLIVLCAICHQKKNGVQTMALPVISNEHIARAKAVKKIILTGLAKTVTDAYKLLYPTDGVWLVNPLRKVSRVQAMKVSPSRLSNLYYMTKDFCNVCRLEIIGGKVNLKISIGYNSGECLDICIDCMKKPIELLPLISDKLRQVFLKTDGIMLEPTDRPAEPNITT